MGFFNALKNIALGKPVFTTPPQQPGRHTPPQAPVGQSAKIGPKIIPQLYIERVNCRTSGDDMEVEVTIQNYSQQELYLDKITMLGSTNMLGGASVSPGEEDGIDAYDGDRPKTTADSQCQVFYKNEEGDYFCSLHTIEYEKLADGTYSVRNIRFTMVRDV